MFRRPSLIAVLASAAFLTAPAAANAFVMTGAPTLVEIAKTDSPVILAQATDTLSRLQQLEEEIRRLNGRVEELSFQLLQAQEDMRRAQENNEIRFQDLEQGTGSAGSGSNLPDRRSDLNTGPPEGGGSASGDDIAAILDGADLESAGAGISTQPVAPSAGAGGDSRIYDAAYDHLLAGDYEEAEQSFRQYVQTYPNAADTPNAEYWLGESLFQQQRYADAAEVFLNAQKAHPTSDRAPEMLLKLGMSLAGLGSTDTACATYREVSSRYPGLSDNVRSKLSQEMSSANC